MRSMTTGMAKWLALILIITGSYNLLEPPTGFEPVTYALREARRTALATPPAQIDALVSRNALGAQRAPDSRATIRSGPAFR